ncbi:helix-turn-helix domain-containing protein [Pediococcus inopinatus]|uniref:helix-turn-helix domain-containing protein n=1 Tax=Pediococcus inopinatus TaxID=114090 RepID=UPI0007C5BB94|nr:helix-turn-helix transcriptional regulator [Pediococcus inopinatus]
MTLFERIKFLANKQGKSINDVESELNYSQNTLYRLKRTNPSAKKLEELADYFDVSTDYLLGRTDTPYPAKHSKLDTLAAHAADRNHKFTDAEIDQMQAYLDGIIDASRKKDKD